jgi:hypothetical protein
LEDFEFSFERLKHLLGDSYNKPDPKKKEKVDYGYDTKKDEKAEEPDIQEVTDE